MITVQKTIIFYLGHPAHYHNISVVIRNLSAKGYHIILVARGKDVLFDLLEGLPYQTIFLNPKKGKGKIALLLTVLKRELVLLRLALKYHPKMLIGTDIAITHIGKLLKIPAVIINEDDAKEVPLFTRFGMKYATAVLAPYCCDISPYNNKKIGYKGYHELAYLHPKYFTPNKTLIGDLLQSGETYFILRFAELSAHHDEGKKGINLLLARQLVDKLKPFGTVYITSERKLEPELEPYRIKIHPKNIHHALYFAQMYIGDSQTMAAEAAVLGTPSIRFNDFVGKLSYLEELEYKYQLTFGIPTNSPELLMDKVDELLNDITSKDRFNKKRELMLNECVDVASFWEKYIIENLKV